MSFLGNYCDRPFTLDAEGVFGGVQFGANKQIGNLVYGLEVDVGWIDISEEKLLIFPTSPNGDMDTASVEYGMYGTMTARLGYDVSDTLVYAKAGLALAEITNTAADLDGGKIYPGSLTRDNGIHAGWALGGGIERSLSDRVSLKVEYLYMDFGSDKSRSPEGDIYEHENELHTAKLGLNWHFSPDSNPGAK